MQKRTKYTSEFRSEAVKLALSSELSSAMISKELGINKNTLYNWISNSMQEKTNSTNRIARFSLPNPASTPPYIRLQQYCKQIRNYSNYVKKLY